MECGALFGRSPPEEKPLIFWRRIMEACGGLASATGKLVAEPKNHALWALSLPPASDFPGLEAEAHNLSAFPVNPHRNWFITQGSASCEWSWA
jgi:hypothetical protein